MLRGKPFEKGRSGNPSGRPKVVGDIRILAREHTKVALDALVEEATSGTGSSRVAAAIALLDRGYGKPTQFTELTGKDGGPIRTSAELTDDHLASIAYPHAAAGRNGAAAKAPSASKPS